MSPDSDNTSRPSGRLRLAAALGGAGVLAVGLGAGVVQTAAQEQPAAAGEDSLGTAKPAKAAKPSKPTSTATSDPTTASTSASTSTTSSTSSAATSTTTAPAAPSAPSAPAQTSTKTATEAAPAEQPSSSAATAASPAVAVPGASSDADEASVETPAAAAKAPGEKKAETKPGKESDEDCPPETAPESAGASFGPGADRAVGAKGDECEDEDEDRDDAKPKRRKKTDPKPRRKAAAKKVAPTAPAAPVLHSSSGVPTVENPTTSLASPGAAPIGVPNFFIDKFRIPPFLLPIYQAAGTEYGIRWEILAAINEIETDYGRNLNVSSAGALGWMQFMPPTWKQYGVDANNDGRKDPYNPVDAIFAAAKYLKAAGGMDDLRKAIFAYNRADWYVDSVLMRARLVGGLPTDLVGSLTGLTQGRFPIGERARYADDIEIPRKPVARGANAARPVESDSTRRGILIYADAGAAAVATHDGRIVKRGSDARLGRYVQVRDAYGNTYTYARLKSLAASHPVAKRGAKPQPREDVPAALAAPAVEPRPGVVSSAGKERLFAHPRRAGSRPAGGAQQLADTTVAAAPSGDARYVRDLLNLDGDQVTWEKLKVGSRVVAGTLLGRVGSTSSTRAPHMMFEIRPAGRGAPRIDPKPVLDGWKLLESTAIYRAKAKNPFFGKDARTPTVGQILLMSKQSLQRRVLANPNVRIYDEGRRQIRAGMIDRRVLALLEFLAANGLEPTVSSLFRPGSITSSGNVSHHASGSAVDIAAVNGTPMMGNQGKGSITDITNRRLLQLQGAMKPAQIISLMSYEGTDNTLAMSDHADHIHVGYRPVGDDRSSSKYSNAVLKPGQWLKVIDRISEIENPKVRTKPSKVSIKVTPKRHGNVGSRRSRTPRR